MQGNFDPLDPYFWYLALLLIALVGAGAWRFLRPSKNNILMLLGWSGIVGIVMVIYVLRHELSNIPLRIAAEFGYNSGISQTYPLSKQGHALVDVTINEVTLPMLFDTGATAIMLQRSDAVGIGLDVSALQFVHPIETASGRSFMAKVRLPSLAIGNILLQDIAAFVNPEDTGISLLGMSALSQLDISLSGDYVQLKSSQH